LSEAVLSPTDDSYVDGNSSNVNNNFGSRNVIWMKSVGNATYERQGFLKFDLSPLAGNTVQSATFKLYTDTPDTDMTASLRRVENDSWNESTITWNNQPSTGNVLE